MVLISGATGFVGTHFLKILCLRKAKSLRAMYRSENKKTYSIKMLKALLSDEFHDYIDQIEWVKADLLDITQLKKAFKGVKQVYHLAAWVGNSPQEYSKMRKINIEGTANMVNLAIEYQVDKFCHMSSVAALGQYPGSNTIDEQAPRDSERKCSRYSITKYGAEMEVWRASQEDLDVVIVNPGVILGSGFFDTGSGEIFGRVINGFKFYPPKQTGFVYVDDVSEIMIQLMLSDIINQRYILVAENTNFKTVMDKIAETFKTQKPSIKVGKFLLYVIWLFQSVVSLIKPIKRQVTLNTIKKINSNRIFDNRKSKEELNWNYTSIDKSINLIFEEYKLLKQNI